MIKPMSYTRSRRAALRRVCTDATITSRLTSLRAPFTIPTLRCGAIALKLLRGLIDQFVAVREHEHAAPVIRPPPRREVREDDRLTGAGRQYHRGAPDAVRPVRA
jgi:hypothetical protein